MRKWIASAILTCACILCTAMPARASELQDAANNGGRTGLNIGIAMKAEETKLAWQWIESCRRVTTSGNCISDYNIQKGYAFEGMSKDANNIRRPFSRIRLEENPSAKGLDATYTKNGKAIQMKASNNSSLQRKGLEGLDDLGKTDGEVWVPKGNKTDPNPRIKETPISQERMERASKATAWAESPLRGAGKAGLIGAVFAGGFEAVEQGIDLNNKGRKLTLDDWRKAGIAIASEMSYGAISGAAAFGAGILLTTAAAPGIVVLIGTAGAGFVAYTGAKWVVRTIKSIF